MLKLRSQDFSLWGDLIFFWYLSFSFETKCPGNNPVATWQHVQSLEPPIAKGNADFLYRWPRNRRRTYMRAYIAGVLGAPLGHTAALEA